MSVLSIAELRMQQRGEPCVAKREGSVYWVRKGGLRVGTEQIRVEISFAESLEALGSEFAPKGLDANASKHSSFDPPSRPTWLHN